MDLPGSMGRSDTAGCTFVSFRRREYRESGGKAAAQNLPQTLHGHRRGGPGMTDDSEAQDESRSTGKVLVQTGMPYIKPSTPDPAGAYRSPPAPSAVRVPGDPATQARPGIAVAR